MTIVNELKDANSAVVQEVSVGNFVISQEIDETNL